MRNEDSKSLESGISGDVVGTLTMMLTEIDEEDCEAELSSPGFPIREEKIEEIMRELYKEITSSNMNPASPPSKIPSPYSTSRTASLTPFEVKSESCGASVSDSGSTMMAGVEYAGPPGKIMGGLSDNGGWGVGTGDLPVMNIHNAVGEKVDGGDLLDAGDEWLARVLRWGPPLELEEWT